MKILQIYIKPMACKKSTISTGGEEKTEKQEALDAQFTIGREYQLSRFYQSMQWQRFLFFLIFSSFLWMQNKVLLNSIQYSRSRPLLKFVRMPSKNNSAWEMMSETSSSLLQLQCIHASFLNLRFSIMKK